MVFKLIVSKLSFLKSLSSFRLQDRPLRGCPKTVLLTPSLICLRNGVEGLFDGRELKRGRFADPLRRIVDYIPNCTGAFCAPIFQPNSLRLLLFMHGRLSPTTWM